jgi:hypothetical protein
LAEEELEKEALKIRETGAVVKKVSRFPFCP